MSTYNSSFATGSAIVYKTIDPVDGGRVRFRGSYWPARCDRSIILQPGETVRVVGNCNITLIVEPMEVRELATV